MKGCSTLRAVVEAEQKKQAAEGYALKRINEAQGDVSRFNAVYAEYVKAPEVTKQRIYIETIEEVFGNIEKIIIDEDGKSVVPYLPLKELGKARNAN